ncbi:MAG TPA: hypothetical protein V6D48_05310, partial [Oculatellaceae cyanobacterium]
MGAISGKLARLTLAIAPRRLTSLTLGLTIPFENTCGKATSQQERQKAEGFYAEGKPSAKGTRLLATGK